MYVLESVYNMAIINGKTKRFRTVLFQIDFVSFQMFS